MKAPGLALVCVFVAIVSSGATAARAAKPPSTWDNLVLVDAKKFQRVYLLPSADFRSYTKVMLDPTEVAFQKNWVRDYNSNTSFNLRLSDSQAQKIISDVRKGFGDIFAKAYAQAGITVVQAPGPDVLRVRTGVVDLSVNAPDVPTAGITRNYAPRCV